MAGLIAAPVAGVPAQGIPVLTGLRLIAALSVALAHGAAATLRIDPASNLSVVKYWLAVGAGLGMPLFFVLSGFVIHYNYAARLYQNGRRGLFEFFWARFTRLYPLYIVVIAGEIVFSGIIFSYVQGQKEPVTLLMEVMPSYITMTQSWVYTLIDGKPLIYAFGIAVPLTWSISTEWFFYLCYPLILIWVSRLKNIYTTLAGIIIFSLFFSAIMLYVTYSIGEMDAWARGWFGDAASSKVNAQNSFVRWILYFSPYARIGEFILGCLVAQLYFVLKPYRVGPLETKIAKVLVPVSIFSVFGIIYVMYVPGADNLIGRLKDSFGLAPAIALLLFCATRYRSRIFDALSGPKVVQLGEASYSIYLIHLFVYSAAVAQAQATLPAGYPESAYLLFRLACALALVLLVSLGTHTFVEVAARKRLRQLGPQTRVTVADSVALGDVGQKI